MKRSALHRVLTLAASALLSVGTVFAVPAPAAAVPIIGLTANGLVLIQFDSAAPSTIVAASAISGLQPGEYIAGIDFRPATGELYGVGIVSRAVTAFTDTGRLYRIDPASGAATLVGAGPFATDLMTAIAYGVDFNPTVDRLRIVNASGENLRVHPVTGARADSPNNDANTGAISAVAYDRNVPPPTGQTTVTTLFGIDVSSDMLVRIGGVDGSPSPNGGVVTNLGSLGVDAIGGDAGFDIDAAGNVFAALTTSPNLAQTRLYTIDLTTGLATAVGVIGDGNLFVGGLAVAPAFFVTISPASGTYATTQRFDVVILIEAAGRTITAGQIVFDGVDVTSDLAPCAVVGARVPTGGLTVRCGLLSLPAGTHTLTVSINFGTAVARASETYVVVQVTEP